MNKKKWFSLSITICLILIMVGCTSTVEQIVSGKKLSAQYNGTKYTFEFNTDDKVLVIGKSKSGVGTYSQEGEKITIQVYNFIYDCTYDGSRFEIVDYGFVSDNDLDVLSYDYNSMNREYILHLPDDYKNAPLVLVLHEFGGSASWASHYMGFNYVADEHNFVVCYPQALIGKEEQVPYWNANLEDGNDDIGFIEALANDLVSEYGLDKEQVYITGFSNGGFMSYTAAINASDTFKKAAVVSGLISHEDWDNRWNAKQIPVLHIHGTEDEVIHITDSPSYDMSVDEIIDFFVEKNKGELVEEVSIGEHTTLYKYGSDSGYDVWYCKMEQWGHRWPNAMESDIDANALIWEFFDKSSN